MGINVVGGMIVVGLEGFVKVYYCKFNIKFEDFVFGDDYGMMWEVLICWFFWLFKEYVCVVFKMGLE